jgi:hypothetical protein
MITLAAALLGAWAVVGLLTLDLARRFQRGGRSEAVSPAGVAWWRVREGRRSGFVE